MLNKKVVSDKSVLFALSEPTLHYIRVAPEKEEYLKVWVKEPTWLEVDKAINSVMKINTRTQQMDLDLNAMFKYMVENFITKTEPSLSAIDCAWESGNNFKYSKSSKDWVKIEDEKDRMTILHTKELNLTK